MKMLKLIFTFFGVLVLTVSCAKKDGTSTGNPVVELQFDTYTPTLSAKVGSLAVSSVTMCFKRLRFKMQGETSNPDPAQDSDNIDFEIGEVTISPGGTDLGSIQLPIGTYTRVEIDLEKQCLSGNSLVVQNDNPPNTFQTDERITVKFHGTFTVDQANETLTMGIQSIISALNTVAADNEIRPKVEAASGTF